MSLGVSFIGVIEKQASYWNRREAGIGIPKNGRIHATRYLAEVVLKKLAICDGAEEDDNFDILSLIINAIIHFSQD